jgi:integrase
MARPPRPWFWKARGVWCVDLRGKRHVLARGERSKKEAQEEFHRLMASLGRGEAVDPSQITVEAVFSLFLDDTAAAVARGERAQVTYDGYVRHLSSADDWFGKMRAAEVPPHRVHAWCESPELRWGPTTRANAIAAVKAAFRWAKRRGYLRVNPLADVEKPTPKRRTAVLSPEKARAVLDAAEGRFRKLLACLWMTGCRPGELATLEAGAVDLEGAILHVRDKIRRTTGKDTREVHATPEVMAIVADLCAAHPAGPIFRNRLGHAWTRNAMACAMARIRKRTGLGKEAVPYSFRHLFGTDALDRGVHAAIVAELMGHRGTKMLLERYTHLEERRGTLRDAARKVRPNDASGASDDAGSSGPGPGPPPDGGVPPGTPGGPPR